MTYKSLLSILSFVFVTTVYAADNKKPDNPVLATVNGVPITLQEVQHFLSKSAQPIAQDQALQEMINVELLVQDARNQQIMSDTELVLEIKRNRSALIASHYLQKILQGLDISEQALKSRYQQTYLDKKQNTEYNANHILIKTEQEANAIIKQLDGGAVFSELAKSLSIGPSGKDGGALGWFKSSDMVAAFSQATMKLKPGQHSREPVQTQFGWHVILLNETREAQAPAFETVRNQLQTSIAAEAIKNKINNLINTAEIKFLE